MSSRSTDTVDSGEPHETGGSVEIEFSEYSNQPDGHSSPESGAKNLRTQHSEGEAGPHSTAPPAWFRNVQQIRVNDPGAQFRLTIRNSQGPMDVSTVTAKQMTFHRPDNSVIQREATFSTDGSDGMICYTTVDGDLNTAGDWQVQAHVDFGHMEFQSEIHRFTVHAAAAAPLLTQDPQSRTSRRAALLEEIKRRKKNAVQLGISTGNVREEIQQNWLERLRVWLTGPESRSLLTSFAVHAVLLLMLSYILFSQISSNDAISLVMSDSNSLPIELKEVDLSMQASGADAETAPQFKKIEQQSTKSVLDTELNDLLKLQGSEGTGAGDEGFGLAFKMPTGGQVVRKGSFAAWTVPKDPRPGQAYDIVVQIQLPKTLRRYPISDLTGRVVGTDKYTLDIPYENQLNRYGTKIQKRKGGPLVFAKRRDYVIVVDARAQVIIHVEGAEQLVEDTIEVRSRMLKENQKLEIEF